MAVRRGVRPIALVSLLFALMAVAFGTQTAGAVSVDTVTGGQSKLFVPLKVVQQLNKDRIISAPNGGAYITFVSTEGPAVVFPISDGTVESSTMLGTVNHPGGLTIQKVDQNFQVTKELVATNFKIVNGNTLVGNVLGLVPAPQGDLINATHSKDPSTGVISYQADVQLNLVTTTILNTYFDTTVFTPGMILGHLVSTIQTKKVIGL